MIRTAFSAVLIATCFLTACFAAGNRAAPSAATSETPVVALIGTGRVGSALGPRITALGMRVVYGSRDPDRADVRQLVQKTGNGASATSTGESVTDADIVVLANRRHRRQGRD